MIRGSCLCGTVRWSFDGVFDSMTHCHCGMCRKAHGAPFATYAGGHRDRFDFDAGRQSVVQYESSPGFHRAFCSICGSVVPFSPGNERIAVPAGTLDDDPGVRPSSHIYTMWKASWIPLSDRLPHHDVTSATDVPRVSPPVASTVETVLSGSCLCSQVAFEVTAAFTRAHNCHCSRCRKGRAAAHTTNGFTSVDNVRFTRGEGALKTYRLPGARYFNQVFCATCGSGMPRLDRERGLAIVPFGALDGDPGRGADSHIFVASMAPWYQITDDLPQFEEMAQ